MLKYLFFLACFFLNASSYHTILEDSKPFGSYLNHEIEIIADTQQRQEIEKISENRLIKKGYSKEIAKNFAKTGVIAEDQYWIWVRDAVLFPTGFSGTYDRLILKNSVKLIPGAAALAVTQDKKIAVIICYRHATRSWEVELPRGAKNKDELIEITAIRELKEETGFSVKSTQLLGNMTPDSGLLASVVPVYYMEIESQNSIKYDQSEAISKTLLVPKKKLLKAIEKGYLIYNKRKIPLRDSFLSFAVLQAKLKKLL